MKSHDRSTKNRLRITAVSIAAFSLIVTACGGGAEAPVAPAPVAPPVEAPAPVEEDPDITEYPHRSLTFVVPFGPGGGTDTLARAFGPYLEAELGVPVIFENIAGAGATIGTTTVFEGEPDGSIIGMPADNALMLAPRLRDDLPYTDYDSFTILFRMPPNPMMMVTATAQPYQSLADAVEAAEAQPGELGVANAGALTTPDVTAELLSLLTGSEFNSVPAAGGGAEARTNVIARRVEFGIAGASAYAGQLEAGELRALAVFWPERLANFPDVPTAQEQGFDIVSASTFYLVGPPGIEPAMQRFLTGAFERAAANAEFQALVENLGAVSDTLDGEGAFAELRDSVPNIDALVTRFKARDF